MDVGIRSVATCTFLFQVLGTYQTRNLTDESDALDAVSGILQRFSQDQGGARTARRHLSIDDVVLTHRPSCTTTKKAISKLVMVWLEGGVFVVSFR